VTASACVSGGASAVRAGAAAGRGHRLGHPPAGTGLPAEPVTCGFSGWLRVEGMRAMAGGL
jgi:hypothetical protein